MAKTLYRYRKFNGNLLSMFINRELYFSIPETLNDPYDCQLPIIESINYAFEMAKTDSSEPMSDEKRNLLDTLSGCAQKMEEAIKIAGVFSLSETCMSVLMWTHYADEHKGVCIGYQFPEDMSEFDSQDLMMNMSHCKYLPKNPIAAYLRVIGIVDDIPLLEWNKFWYEILGLGLITKHKSWKYEKEIRILRKRSGTIKFLPEHIAEITFGIKTNPGDIKTIVNLLGSPEWSHVKYYKMIKDIVSFDLRKVRLNKYDVLQYLSG